MRQSNSGRRRGSRATADFAGRLLDPYTSGKGEQVVQIIIIIFFLKKKANKIYAER